MMDPWRVRMDLCLRIRRYLEGLLQTVELAVTHSWLKLRRCPIMSDARNLCRTFDGNMFCFFDIPISRIPLQLAVPD